MSVPRNGFVQRLRRRHWPALSCGLLLAAIGASSDAAAAPPNVLLIVADDLGFGDLGCYGNRAVRTPHIDRLAAEGARFTQFRVNPLCAPTRASLLTGQYSLETGVWRAPNRTDAGEDRARRLEPEHRLLPEYLKQAGYATGMFGKWHLGYESPNLPNDRGFEQFVGFLGGSHPYDASRRSQLVRNGEPFTDPRHLTDIFTDEAIAFIEKQKDGPFFCYVPYNAVHGPLWAADRERPSATPEWLEKVAGREIDQPRRDYYATLEHLDHSVGRLSETLSRLGLTERTLVIFVSDNGALEDKYPGDNGPLRGQKGETYEGGIRVPAIVRWPGVAPAGTVSDAPAMVFDLFTTIVAAAGVAPPTVNGGQPVHGIDLASHLRSGGTEPLPDRHLFWDLWGKLGAFHDGWKLVGMIDNHRGRFDEALPQIEAAQFELYYLPDDLGEQRNLAAERPEITADLKARLVEWFRVSTQPAPPP